MSPSAAARGHAPVTRSGPCRPRTRSRVPWSVPAARAADGRPAGGPPACVRGASARGARGRRGGERGQPGAVAVHPALVRRRRTATPTRRRRPRPSAAPAYGGGRPPRRGPAARAPPPRAGTAPGPPRRRASSGRGSAVRASGCPAAGGSCGTATSRRPSTQADQPLAHRTCPQSPRRSSELDRQQRVEGARSAGTTSGASQAGSPSRRDDMRGPEAGMVVIGAALLPHDGGLVAAQQPGDGVPEEHATAPPASPCSSSHTPGGVLEQRVRRSVAGHDPGQADRARHRGQRPPRRHQPRQLLEHRARRPASAARRRRRPGRWRGAPAAAW